MGGEVDVDVRVSLPVLVEEAEEQEVIRYRVDTRDAAQVIEERASATVMNDACFGRIARLALRVYREIVYRPFIIKLCIIFDSHAYVAINSGHGMSALPSLFVRNVEQFLE